jgi:hypothetical protein
MTNPGHHRGISNLRLCGTGTFYPASATAAVDRVLNVSSTPTWSPTRYNGDMKHRKLRIAWSVVWGLLATFLTFLSVWSYWWWDRCYFQGVSTGVQINSDAGHIVLVTGPSEPTVTEVIFGHFKFWSHRRLLRQRCVGILFQTDPRFIADGYSLLVGRTRRHGNRHYPMALNVVEAILPPHAPHRHHARCRWTRTGRVAPLRKL